eukprot:5482006-Alexandrium_andersonii.AAC.1
MSASLVGSEMCIRDSRQSAISTILGYWRARGRAIRSREASNRKRCGSRPVSYTHLTLPTICSV